MNNLTIPGNVIIYKSVCVVYIVDKGCKGARLGVFCALFAKCNIYEEQSNTETDGGK